jgi:hypothetical protein
MRKLQPLIDKFVKKDPVRGEAEARALFSHHRRLANLAMQLEKRKKRLKRRRLL